MTPEKAQKILEQLAAGKDPRTGRNLPTGGPLNTGDVVRALHIGAIAVCPLERKDRATEEGPRRPAEATKNSEPARSGKRWTPTEVARVVAAYDSGVSIIALARLYQRKRYAIASRLVAEGRDGKLSEIFQPDDEEEEVAPVRTQASSQELPI
jgi:hypothetical protein